MTKVAGILVALALVAACGGDDEKLPDARVVDAQVIDAIVIDAPAPDAADVDAMDADASTLDAVSIDATMAVNGCTQAGATDGTAVGFDRTVAFGGATGLAYAPRCLRVAAGQAVTFAGTFASHPLQAGTVVGSVATPAAGSPIPTTATGTTATATFTTTGTFPYYCTIHGVGGMNGVVYVE